MSRRHLTPLLVAAFAISLTILWQVWELRELRAQEIERHERYARACLQAVSGVALSEGRGGRYDPEAMRATFEELRKNFGLASIALLAEDERELVRAGTDPEEEAHSHFRAPFSPLVPRWGAGRGRPTGRGSSRLEELPERGLEIEIVLPLADLNAHLASYGRRGVLTSLVLSGAALLVALLVQARLRHLGLRATLAHQDARLQSLDYLGRLGAGLVHETKNPLGVVRGFAERIARGSENPPELRRNAEAIVAETDRTVARLDEFLLLSRPAALKRSEVELAALFAELHELIASDLDARRATLEIRVEAPRLSADREQLRRLLLNLLLNATAAIDTGGHLWLASELGGEGLRLVVEDDGPGVPAQLRDSLFEPYVSGRPGGTGLGLAICQRIALDHGFELKHEERTPRGTRMLLIAPGATP